MIKFAKVLRVPFFPNDLILKQTFSNINIAAAWAVDREFVYIEAGRDGWDGRAGGTGRTGGRTERAGDLVALNFAQGTVAPDQVCFPS